MTEHTTTTPQRQAAGKDRIRKALRATEGMQHPEQSIAAAKQALSDAIHSLERLPDREGAFRVTVIQECRTALALLGGRPV